MGAKGGSAASGPRRASGTLKTKSAAEFFAENKNLAGFDNPGKSLYTTIRELVENSVDAAEAIGVLPDIGVRLREHRAAGFNAMMGRSEVEKRDASLYADYETAAQVKKREAKEAKDAARRAKLLAPGGDEDPAAAGVLSQQQQQQQQQASQGDRGGQGGGVHVYEVECVDNGGGMAHEDIPEMLGRVLSGTNYALKQTRGKFGLGAKMALIWSKQSTDQPIEVWSAQPGQAFISRCLLDINVQKNEPRVLAHEKLRNDGAGGDPDFPAGWHGTRMRVTVEGNWGAYSGYIKDYMRRMAVITPYARFELDYKPASVTEREAAERGPSGAGEDAGAGAGKGRLRIRWSRRTDAMPRPPTEVKHHPSSVDLLVLKRLIADTRCTSLGSFLNKEFTSIDGRLAARLAKEVMGGDEGGAKLRPGKLTPEQVARMHQLLRRAKFAPPTGDCLSPAGEYNLLLGVLKEIRPEFVATSGGNVCVFEGHPFIVEAAVTVGQPGGPPPGGIKMSSGGIAVFRFANRIPLLFMGGNDVVTQQAKAIRWKNYKIEDKDAVGVFVSIVSTKIPFSGAGKECISNEVEELAAAVSDALKSCGRQLKAKMMKREKLREQAERKRKLVKYIASVCNSIYTVAASAAKRRVPHLYPAAAAAAAAGEAEAEAARGAAAAKDGMDLDDLLVSAFGVTPEEVARGRPKEEAQTVEERVLGLQSADEEKRLLEDVARGKITEAYMAAKLEEHVKQIDVEMIEAQVEAGLASSKDERRPLLVGALSHLERDTQAHGQPPPHPGRPCFERRVFASDTVAIRLLAGAVDLAPLPP